MHVAAKIAIGVGAVGAVGAAVAYAVTRTVDPEKLVHDNFGSFDKNEDGVIGRGEATSFDVGRPYPRTRQILQRNGDWVTWSQDIAHTETTSSMLRIWNAAKGNDAVASYEELTKVIASFDRDGDGKLGWSERGDLSDRFGVVRDSRTIIDDVIYGTTYEPK